MATDRFSRIGAAVLLLGAALALRSDAPDQVLTIAHAFVALVTAAALLRSPWSAGWLAGAAALWAGAQLLRAVDLDQSLTLGAMALAGIFTLLAARAHALHRNASAVLVVDYLTSAFALVAVEWFALRDRTSGLSSLNLALMIVGLALPAALAITLYVHLNVGVWIVLAALGLAGFGLGIGFRVDLPWWDLIGAIALLMVLLALGRRRNDSSPLQTSPAVKRLLPVLLLTLALGSAFVSATGEYWQEDGYFVAGAMLAIIVIRQVITLRSEQRMMLTIASQGQALHHQAFHDPLTHLANRDLFHDRLQHALTLRQRAFAPLAVVHLDINEFAHVNDQYGQGTGDTVLVALADRLSTWVRPTDTVARLGGDEFAIIVDGSQDAAIVVAERIRNEIAQGFEISGRTIHITVSIGVAALMQMQSDVLETSSRLLNAADKAMHQSQRDPEHAIALIRV